MDEVFMVLVMAFVGGFIGGTVCYALEKYSRSTRLQRKHDQWRPPPP